VLFSVTLFLMVPQTGSRAETRWLMPNLFLGISVPLLLGVCLFFVFAQLEKAVCLKYKYEYQGKGTASAFGRELTSLEQNGGASEKWQYNVWEGVAQLWDDGVGVGRLLFSHCFRFSHC